MNKSPVFFILIFILLWSGLNLYCFLLCKKIFPISPKIILFIFLLLFLSFPLGIFSRHFLPYSIFHSLFLLGTLWLGILFILDVAFLFSNCIQLINIFTKYNFSFILLGRICFSIGLIASIWGLYNATNIEVKYITIESEHLPEGMEQLNIIQLSDIHLGGYHNKEYLDKIVSIIQNIDYDMIVITGDLLSLKPPKFEKMVSGLKKLNPKYGKYFVNGNHEKYLGESNLNTMLDQNNIINLNNKSKTIGSLRIIGLNYSRNNDYTPTQIEMLSNFDKDKEFCILLDHTPRRFKLASEKGVQLQLSGHTHQGQIWPFGYFSLLVNKYLYGLYSIGNSKLYVTSGAGTWGPPIRLFTHSEIVAIKLIKKK